MARETRSSTIRAKSTPSAQIVAQEPVQLSSPPATPVTYNGRKRKVVKVEQSSDTTIVAKALSTPKSNKRAKRLPIKEEDIDGLPHNLGVIPKISVSEDFDESLPSAKKNQRTKAQEKIPVAKNSVKNTVANTVSAIDDLPNKTKAKNSTYGLTPGHTPYPNYSRPTPEECEEVTRILSQVHGQVQVPKTIPAPSLEVSGCGEVPSVLDALIRTRLSAATSGTNSSRAFAGLVSKFGILKEGVGRGSVDWNKVRLADQKEIFEAIKSGGLADVKSKDIKRILQMVWEENQARRHEILSFNKTELDFVNEGTGENKAEVEKAESNVVSLDHLHTLSNDEAFAALVKYPGIGPKTASCVLLFCLQRPSFAVDTHVFRLCKWLGWVPAPGNPAGLAPGAKGCFAGPTRNSTYAHCEVRIPDHLKYPLHQLLIQHGKSCPRCRAITGESSDGWDQGCPIDHLVQRSGGRKGAVAAGSGKAGTEKKAVGKGKKRKENTMKEEYESDARSSGLSDAESSNLSDLGSDTEVEVSEEEQESSSE